MFGFKSKFDRYADREVSLKNKIALIEKEQKEDIDAINKQAKSEIENIKVTAAAKIAALKSKLDLTTRYKNAEHDHVVQMEKPDKK